MDDHIKDALEEGRAQLEAIQNAIQDGPELLDAHVDLFASRLTELDLLSDVFGGRRFAHLTDTGKQELRDGVRYMLSGFIVREVEEAHER